MYSYRTSIGPADRRVDLAFTDRFGGVSAAPYDALNLGVDGPDAPAAVQENTRRLIADFAPGATLVDLRQVHGNVVLAAEECAGLLEADALVGAQAGPVLMVRAADCVPVLLADSAAGVVGAAHCGRPGLAARVVPAVVGRLRALGATDLTAWIGPHVCGGCYEVPADLQAEVGEIEPASVATTTWGTPSLDLGAGVRAQLERDGVTVVDVARCTRESPDLYSHRRDGRAAGRLAGVIRIVP